MLCPICGEETSGKEKNSHLKNFVQCPNCAGHFSKLKASADYPSEYFVQAPGGKPSIFSRLLNLFLWLRLKKIHKFLPKGNQLVLDYGCGNGKLVAYLKNQKLLVDGYDPSPSAVALAQKSGLPVFSSLPGKKYGLVMFWHSLEHTDSPLSDFQKLSANFDRGSRVLIAVPNAESWEAKIFGKSWFCYDWPYHRVHFNLFSLEKFLNHSGFRIIGVDFVNPEYTLSSFVQSVLNLFLPKNVFYSLVSNRREERSRRSLLLLSIMSLLILLVLSPILLPIFILMLIFKKTAALIVVAERAS